METVNEQQALVKMLDPFYTKMANHLLAQGVKYVNRRGWPVIHNSKGHKCAVGVIFPDVKKARNDGFMLSGNNLMLLLQAIEPEKHEVSKHELVSELNERASIHDSWEPKSWEGILLKHSEKKGYTWRPTT